jgi:hypothetical protein
MGVPGALGFNGFAGMTFDFLINQSQWLQCPLRELDGVYIHGKLTSSQP